MLLQTIEDGKIVTYFYRLIELGFDETAHGLKEGKEVWLYRAIQKLEELLFIALMEKFEEDGILDIIRKNLVAFVTGKIGEFSKNWNQLLAN